MRPPRPPEHGWPDAGEEANADLDSLLEPGALREGFSAARRETGRPRRWLADLVGHGHSRSAAVEQPAADNGHEHDPTGRLAELEQRGRELEERERELRALARRDETLREREQWIAGRREELQRRLDELEAVERSLELRERELLRREEAAARWFTELSRTQRLIEEKQHRLEPRDGAEAPVA